MEPFIAIALLLAGVAALYFGADWLVRGSVALALGLGIPPVIVGLTIVAFGTSSPELLVSFNAGRMGNADIAIGNVIGSNIANVALILGAAAFIRPIVMNIRAVRFDILFMLAVSGLLTVLVLDRDLDRGDGVVFLAGIARYVGFKVWQAMRRMREGRVDELDLEVAEGDQVNLGQTLVSLYPQVGLELRAKIPATHQDEIVAWLARGGVLSAQGQVAGHDLEFRLVRVAGAAGMAASLSASPWYPPSRGPTSSRCRSGTSR